MNKKEQMRIINSNQRKYHIPSMSNIHPRKRNCIFINVNNTLIHERVKLEVCYLLRKEGYSFITEACSNKTGERYDVVNLNSGDIIEVIHSHRDPKVLKRYEEIGVIKVFTEKGVKEQLKDVL